MTLYLDLPHCDNVCNCTDMVQKVLRTDTIMAGLWYFLAEAVKEVNQGQYEESSAQIFDILQNIPIDSQKISSSVLM